MRRLFAVCLVLFLGSMSGCVTADRFGVDDDPTSTDADDPVLCDGDEDCWDGDDSTEDVCGDDGYCYFPSIDDTDTGTDATDAGLCDVYGDFTGDGDMDIFFDRPVQQPSHTDSLLNAKVLRITLGEERKVWAGVGDNAPQGLMFVLLDDCANSSANRIAWGESIYSPLLEPGVYYLAAFSSVEEVIPVATRFHKTTTCDDAPSLEIGLIENENLFGLADDFTGSCVQGDGKGPRGDKVYRFDVPEEEVWDVTVDLFPKGASLVHHMYLTRGCGAEEVIEIDCQLEYALEDSTNQSSRKKIFVTGENLCAGRYYLFVDTTDALQFDAGKFDLEFGVTVVSHGL